MQPPPSQVSALIDTKDTAAEDTDEPLLHKAEDSFGNLVTIAGASLNAPERLDVVVARLVDAIPSRSFAARLIDAGLVLVDGKRVKASFRVETRHTVEVDISFLERASTPPQGEAIPLTILFEDDDILVIDKPAGLVVHPGAGVSSGTLVNAVLAHCGSTLPSLGGAERAGIVHRLDRDTSGVMVVAKSQRALTELSRQFSSHTQERRYLALCYGTPPLPSGTLETWHGRDPRNRLRFAVVAEGQGKRARLDYTVNTVFGEERASLVECLLHTGRTHQIRVQLTSVRAPLLGDALYALPQKPLSDNKSDAAALGKLLNRQMLHARLLALTHPASGSRMVFESQPPADFQEVVMHLKMMK
jgi:23S rRNA pseudouridine1911/1915/1917 synthase